MGQSLTGRFRIGAVTLFFILVLSACVPQRIRGGENVKRSELATLIHRSGVGLSVNDVPVSMHSSSLRIAPGVHRLKAEVTRGSIQSPGEERDPREIRFAVAPGRTYHIKGSSALRQCVWVADAESGEVVSTDDRGCGRRELPSWASPDVTTPLAKE